MRVPNIFYKNQGREAVRIFPLGGIGNVTKNMFVYEYWADNRLVDILLIDCGIGFPDMSMYGVDLVIPDISYLLDKREKIRGMVMTHGHDDHIGALSYILPKLPAFPIYATRLTSAFIEVKLKEYGIVANLKTITFNDQINLGRFHLQPVRVTHSIPDAANYVITTPIGIFYHGSDFKFDLTPLDNQPSELGKIAAAGDKGILCLLSDCLGSEKSGFTLSERAIEDTLEKEIRDCPGKFIFTTQSSNISRIQQAIDVGLKRGRKIAFIGRSVEKNTETARKLGYIKYPQDAVLRDKQLLRHPDASLFLIVAGSQGQAESGLFRIARGEHKYVHTKEGDVVVFSADPIPGNENSVHALVDTLTKSGVRVVYSEVMDNLHRSGHGTQQDLQLMLSLTKPKYILPIGGTYRQMVAYQKLAMEMKHSKDSVLLPDEGQILEFTGNDRPKVVQKVATEQIMVDGLGIGDVGNVVLRDRKTLAKEGIVVIVIPVSRSLGKMSAPPDIISRGFVYMKESGALVEMAKKIIVKTLDEKQQFLGDWQNTRREIEENVAKFLFKETGRRPLIVPVLVEV